MAMTESERFHFDLAGFLVRPAILSPDEVAGIREQIYKMKHEPDSLPPEHREAPGGPSSILIDHPKVIDVLHDIIGPDIRMEGTYCAVRKKGEGRGALHNGGPQQAQHTNFSVQHTGANQQYYHGQPQPQTPQQQAAGPAKSV